MKPLKTQELIKLYFNFFSSKGHKIIPSASLIPCSDTSVLFTSAGMHPLMPYLAGKNHPEGSRLANVQKVIRTGSIEKVGSASYCTFFELLGNWSLGDYYKKEAITYAWEFLTSENCLGIDKNKLFFTCFDGSESHFRDVETYQSWINMGVNPSHIFALSEKYNWKGPYGQDGICGPNTRIFFDTDKPSCNPKCNPYCACGKYLEMWDIVFFEYYKHHDNIFYPLHKKCVDTGMGIERVAAILQGTKSIFDTDAFANIISDIEKLSSKNYNQSQEIDRTFRIVADHIRCATFILGDSHRIIPSNTGQGYILRRVIRRAIRFAIQLDMSENSLYKIADAVISQYGNFYTELFENKNFIIDELLKEEQKFYRSIKKGLDKFNKMKSEFVNNIIDGSTAFYLFQTFGFPLEFTEELAKENGFSVDIEGFEKHLSLHKEKSKIGVKKTFSC